MRLQSHQNSCGPATVANVLRSLGFKTPNGDMPTEDWVVRKCKLAGSMNDIHPAYGTTEAQIRQCLTTLKVPHFQFLAHDPNLAVAGLRGFLGIGWPVMLAVLDDSHWVAALSIQGERISVVDSANSELNVYYSPEEVAQFWASASDPPRFYGLVITGKSKKGKGK